MEEERTRLQKIVLLSLAVMTLAFGILTGVSKLHPGAQFGGTLFQPAQTEEKMTYTGKLRGRRSPYPSGRRALMSPSSPVRRKGGGAMCTGSNIPWTPSVPPTDFKRERWWTGSASSRTESAL